MLQRLNVLLSSQQLPWIKAENLGAPLRLKLPDVNQVISKPRLKLETHVDTGEVVVFVSL